MISVQLVGLLLILGIVAAVHGQAGNGTVGTNWHGLRYCEVLAVEVNGTHAIVKVYNTMGLNDCPSTLWDALTPVIALAAVPSANQARLNGPRYWLMDVAGATDPEPLFPGHLTELKTFGGIDMRLGGQIVFSLGEAMSGKIGVPYNWVQVSRKTNWTWNQGSTGYFLVDGSGNRFIMQSYSQMVDKNLTETDLPNLASKLTKLPAGWAFQAVKLDKPVNVTSGDLKFGVALSDELANTYSAVDPKAVLNQTNKPSGSISAAGKDMLFVYVVASLLIMVSL